MDGCLSATQIQDLLLGAPSEARLEEVRAHLSACSGCRETLGHLDKDNR